MILMDRTVIGLASCAVGALFGFITATTRRTMSAKKIAKILEGNVNGHYKCNKCDYESSNLLGILEHLERHGVTP